MYKTTLIALCITGLAGGCSSASNRAPAPHPHDKQIDPVTRRHLALVPSDVNILAGLDPHELTRSKVFEQVAAPMLADAGADLLLAKVGERCHVDVLGATRRVMLGQAGVDGAVTLVIEADWATPDHIRCIIGATELVEDKQNVVTTADGAIVFPVEGRMAQVRCPEPAVAVVTLANAAGAAARDTPAKPGTRDRLLAAMEELDTTRPVWVAAVDLPQAASVLDEAPSAVWFDLAARTGVDVIVGLRFETEDAGGAGRDTLRRMFDEWRSSQLSELMRRVRVDGDGRDAVISAAFDTEKVSELVGVMIYSLMSRRA